jgi:hypothetical protein
MFSHSTVAWGPSPGVAEAIVGRSLTTTNEEPVLNYTGQPERYCRDVSEVSEESAAQERSVGAPAAPHILQ